MQIFILQIKLIELNHSANKNRVKALFLSFKSDYYLVLVKNKQQD